MYTHENTPHTRHHVPQVSSGGSGSNMGNSAGWPAYASDRPKSANFTGGNTSSGAGSAGLMASLTGAGRPSSSQQATGGTNWAAQQQQQQQMQQQGQMAGGGAGGAGAANGNTLSYGSLKNRFLSGASKNNNGAGTATSSGANPSNNGAKPAPSKLFSLAR